jgi:hypothetical protein
MMKNISPPRRHDAKEGLGLSLWHRRSGGGNPSP